MSEKREASCGGCLGIILMVALIGSLFSSNAGIFVRTGSLFFTFGKPTVDGRLPGTLAEAETLEANKKAAEVAVKNIHSQLDQGKCDEIHDQSSVDFKSYQTKESVSAVCLQWKKFGGLKSSEIIDWWGRPTEDDKVRQILVRYLTVTQAVPIVETFVWSVKEGKAELVNYQFQLNSPVNQPSPSSPPSGTE